MNDLEASLFLPEIKMNLPIKQSSKGFNVLDVSGLIGSGYFTFDPGFLVTASCESKITFIDGESGVLLYSGYPISQLTEQSSFLEVCYLLLNNELPNSEAYGAFTKQVLKDMFLPEHISYLLKGFRFESHPMAILCSLIGSFPGFMRDYDFSDKKDRLNIAATLISKMPVIVAAIYRYINNLNLNTSSIGGSYTENFYQMMFDKEATDIITKALEVIFIAHADHEQNASTSTVRLVASSGSHPFACISSGIASLWGYLHGGANEACLKMLGEIGSIENIPKFIAKAKDPEDSFRLMGFGHRVYKNFDPRSKIIKKTCHQLLDSLSISDPLLDIAIELEHQALQDSYFKDKKLYPNVDFYSGIMMRALGIPSNMFTAIFALSRSSGWISHWHEMLGQGAQKISRPRQMYTGYQKRDYKNINNRI